MTRWIGAAILVTGFVAVMRGLGVVARAKRVIREANEALAIVRDQGIGDEVKERQLQQQALRLFRLFFFLAAAGTAAILLPALVVWVVAQVGWLNWNDVVSTAASVEFLVTTTLFAIIVAIVARRSSGDV